MRLQTCTPDLLESWVSLRQLLWPYDADEHRREAQADLENPGMIVLLALDDAGEAIGFAQASMRRDYVNGCNTSPVGFLEGIYVRETARGKGVARALCRATEDWAAARGCQEMASDAWLDADASHRMHAALGFSETERVVYFRKSLAR
jgi:aminoglycoside 6'-N-acetyltransferase I